MKQLIFTTALLAATSLALADTPGKPTNHPIQITLQNVASLQDYTLYWKKYYEDTTLVVAADTSLKIPGSGGAPDGAEFWGIHKKTGRSTDTIRFSNYYSPDQVVLLNGMHGDSIRYDLSELSNANQVTETANKDSIANKQLLVDAETITKDHTLKNILLGTLAGAALGGMAWFFIRRRKKQQQA